MHNTTYRILFIHPYNIDSFECWLSDMSKKGLDLISVSNIFAKFRINTSSHNIYKLYITNKDSSNSRVIYDYTQNGWEYITKHNDIIILRYRNENTCEDIKIYIDTDSINYLKSKLKSDNKAFYLILIIVVLTSLTPLIFLLSDKITLISAIQTFLLYLPLYFVFMDNIIVNKRLIRKIEKIDHSKNLRWRLLYAKKIIIFYFIIFYYILLTYFIIIK